MLVNRFIKVKEHQARTRSDEEILGFDPLMPMEKMTPQQKLKATSYLMSRYEERQHRSDRPDHLLGKFIHKAKVR